MGRVDRSSTAALRLWRCACGVAPTAPRPPRRARRAADVAPRPLFRACRTASTTPRTTTRTTGRMPAAAGAAATTGSIRTARIRARRRWAVTPRRPAAARAPGVGCSTAARAAAPPTPPPMALRCRASAPASRSGRCSSATTLQRFSCGPSRATTTTRSQLRSPPLPPACYPLGGSRRSPARRRERGPWRRP